MASSRVMFQPEMLIQKARIEADGGIVIDIEYMNRCIKSLKESELYSSTRLISGVKFGVKKDANNYISKVYDISGNNNDFIQPGSIYYQPKYMDGIYFNGNGNALYAIHNESINLNTLTCFIQISAIPQTGWKVIIGKINDSLKLRYSIECAGTTSAISARLDTVNFFNKTLPASNVLTGTRKSIAFVIGSSKSSLAVNGLTAYSTNFNNAGIANTSNLELGRGVFNGYVFNTIIFDNNLSDPELINLEQILN